MCLEHRASHTLHISSSFFLPFSSPANYFFLLKIIFDFTSSINHFQQKFDVIVKKTSQWFKSCNPPPPGNWGVWIIIKFQRIKLHRGKLEGLGKKKSKRYRTCQSISNFSCVLPYVLGLYLYI